MPTHVIIIVFGACAAVLVIQAWRILARRRRLSAEIALDAELERACGTDGSGSLEQSLLSSTLWTIADAAGQPVALGLSAPRSMTEPSPDDLVEVPPMIYSFSSREALYRFRTQILGQLLARTYHYVELPGRQIFAAAHLRQVSVRLNPDGPVQKVFTIQEVQNMLGTQSGPS